MGAAGRWNFHTRRAQAKPIDALAALDDDADDSVTRAELARARSPGIARARIRDLLCAGRGFVRAETREPNRSQH